MNLPKKAAWPDGIRGGPALVRSGPVVVAWRVFKSGFEMAQALNPADIRAPFARYSHGIVVPAGARLVFVSGQLGVAPDDSVADAVEAQTECCFSNIAAVLAEAGMGLGDIVRLNAFVTRREDLAAYMAVRDRTVGNPPPASTLVIVSGFARPEFLVEVEAIAAKAEVD